MILQYNLITLSQRNDPSTLTHLSRNMTGKMLRIAKTTSNDTDVNVKASVVDVSC
jgi:hypothetical protein